MNRVLILLALLSAGCHHEHAEDRVIEARAFVVTDGEGRPRGLWEYRAEREAVESERARVAERIRSWRDESGLTLPELARRSGVATRARVRSPEARRMAALTSGLILRSSVKAWMALGTPLAIVS